MKKALALLLLVCFLLPLLGCTQAKQTDPVAEVPKGFLVGHSSKIVNPDTTIPLVGYSNTYERYSKEIGDDMKLSVTIFSDGEGTDIALVNTDLCTISRPLGESFQMCVNSETGIPVERVYVSGNHSHSAPSITGNTEEEQKYNEKWLVLLAEASREAMADRKPAKMYTGSIETENLNFVKHYQYVDENGVTQFFGDNFGTAVYNDTTTHTTQVDSTMHLLKITREGCKDVVIANWRAHPHFTGGTTKYVLSSDYPGAFREALEKQTGCEAVYLQGACGNVNSSTRLEKERRASDVRTHGALLAGYAIEGLENNMTEITTGKIETMQFDYYGDINHTFDHLYMQAKTVSAIWNSTHSYEEAKPYMTPYGIRSVYHASGIVGNYNRTKEVDGRLTMNAVCIGDEFAFVTFPGELFDTISMGVEEGSPYDTTMLIGYSTGHIGYLPSAYGFEYTCYETDITRFTEGTGEIVRDEYIRMLNELKED